MALISDKQISLSTVVEAEVDRQDISINVTDSTVDAAVINSTTDIEVSANHYVLSSPGIYAGDNVVPPWIGEAVADAVNATNVYSTVNLLKSVIDNASDGFQTAMYSTNTALEASNTLINTVKTSNDNALAAYGLIIHTKITADEATVIMSEGIGTEFNTFNTNAESWFNTYVSSQASAIGASTTAVNTLTSSFTDLENDTAVTAGQVETIYANTGIDINTGLLFGSTGYLNVMQADLDDTDVRLTTEEGVSVGTHVWDGIETPRIGMTKNLGTEVYLGEFLGWVANNDVNSTNSAAAIASLETAIGVGIADLQGQIDGNIVTWFYDNVPTLINAPASTWTTNIEKANHVGDLYYDKLSGFGYRFAYEDIIDDTPDQGIVYSWIRIVDVDVVLALSNAADAQATADGKRAIYYLATPPVGSVNVPLDTGDMWIPSIDNGIYLANEIYLYNLTTTSWDLATKYTDNQYAIDLENGTKQIDLSNHINTLGWQTASEVGISADAAVDAFITTQYAQDQLDIGDQLDGKAVSYFQATEPYTAASGIITQTGDTWYNTTTKELKVFKYDAITPVWELITDPYIQGAYEDAATAQASADGKVTSFTGINSPTNYNIGDIWLQGSTGDVYVSNASSAIYNVAHWILASKYTDDTAANRIVQLYSAPLLSPPVADGIGDIWVVTDRWYTAVDEAYVSVKPTTNIGNQVKKWNGTVWEDILYSSKDSLKNIAWAGGASKFITAPDGSITGWGFADGSGIPGIFKISADKFSLVNSNGTATPLVIDATDPNDVQMTFNGKVTFGGGTNTSLSNLDPTQNTKLGTISSYANQTYISGNAIYGVASGSGTTVSNLGISINSNGTLSGAGSGQVTATGVGAETPSGAASKVLTAQENAAIAQNFTSYSAMESAFTTLGKTVISGGYINTGLVNASSIVADYVYAGTIDANKINVGTLSGHTITGAYGKFTKEVLDDVKSVLYATSTTGERTAFFDGAATGINHIVQIGKANETSYGGLLVNGLARGVTCTTYGINSINLNLVNNNAGGTGVYINSVYVGVDARLNADQANRWGLYTDSRVQALLFIPFTGAHIAVSTENKVVGDILYAKFAIGVDINQSYVEVEATNTQFNKKVFGVCSNVDDNLAEWFEKDQHYNTVSTDGSGNTVYTPKSEYKEYVEGLITNGYKCITVNSLGEGMINVCSINGNIDNGDYICSSGVIGKGMKQDDDILHNYTVAKALSDTIWADEVDGVDGCYMTADNLGVLHKTKMVPCTYHCG